MSPRFPTSQTMLRAFLVYIRRMNELYTIQTGRAASVKEKEISETVLLYWTGWMLSGQIFYRRRCSLFTIRSLTPEEQEVTRERKGKGQHAVEQIVLLWAISGVGVGPGSSYPRTQQPSRTTRTLDHAPETTICSSRGTTRWMQRKELPAGGRPQENKKPPWPSQLPPILIVGWPQSHRPPLTRFPGRLDHTPSSPGQRPRGQRRAHPQVQIESRAPQNYPDHWQMAATHPSTSQRDQSPTRSPSVTP